MINIKDYLKINSLYFAKFFGEEEAPWNLVRNINSFIKENGSNIQGFKKIKNGVYAGENVQISKNAEIVGPTLIGAGTKIGAGALLREGVIIGENCNIGHSSEVKHSVIGNNTNASHFNYIGDSIVGSGVNLGAGVILANFKSGAANKEIAVEVDGKKIGTGLEKFGSLIGDNVNIGSNSVTDPGVIIGKNAIIYPLTLIRGTIASNKIVKYKPNLEIVDKK